MSTSFTVDQLKQILEELSQSGHGNKTLGVPFNPGHTTMGSKPTAKIVGAHKGIDWDTNTVFLTPDVELGATDKELQAKLREMENKLGKIYFLSTRLNSGSSPLELEQQVEQFKSTVESAMRPTTTKLKR